MEHLAQRRIHTQKEVQSGLKRIVKGQWGQWIVCTSNTVRRADSMSHLLRGENTANFLLVEMKTTAVSGSSLPMCFTKSCLVFKNNFTQRSEFEWILRGHNEKHKRWWNQCGHNTLIIILNMFYSENTLKQFSWHFEPLLLFFLSSEKVQSSSKYKSLHLKPRFIILYD